MAAGEREEPGVWQQLRRRRVTRTVVTYVAVGFALLEGVWLFAPVLGFVEDVSRVVTGIVVLGFPLAVVLAWTYDLTTEGIVRTPDREIAEPADSRAPLLRRWVWLFLVVCALAVGFVFRSMRM
jgi:FtsH-binding integral membrane protein